VEPPTTVVIEPSSSSAGSHIVTCGSMYLARFEPLTAESPHKGRVSSATTTWSPEPASSWLHLDTAQKQAVQDHKRGLVVAGLAAASPAEPPVGRAFSNDVAAAVHAAGVPEGVQQLGASLLGPGLLCMNIVASNPCDTIERPRATTSPLKGLSADSTLSGRHPRDAYRPSLLFADSHVIQTASSYSLTDNPRPGDASSHAGCSGW
jgi:hypothetical protein